jgi:D-beta-D-heptose 7-phosphate kinase/D-beta-D-heptose 1-phosphate adenosyltransferase
LKQIESKILSLDTLLQRVGEWKNEGEKIVFTNGVFDLIHRGHITYLDEAASLGTRFIVGLNSDASVKELSKGPARPIKDEMSRAIILAAMQFVDAVVIFSESTPRHLIDAIVPDVLAKGGDYDPGESNPESKNYIVGRETVLAHHGKVVAIPFLPGFSTTALEKKIIEAHK